MGLCSRLGYFSKLQKESPITFLRALGSLNDKLKEVSAFILLEALPPNNRVNLSFVALLAWQPAFPPMDFSLSEILFK